MKCVCVFFLSFVRMWTERERADTRSDPTFTLTSSLREVYIETNKIGCWWSGRACGLTLPFIRFSHSVCVCLCVRSFFHATPIRGGFVLFRFLVCRRPIKSIQFFFFRSLVCSVHSMRSVDFLPFAFESALTLSLEALTHTHGTGEPAYTHRSTRSFRYVCCVQYIARNELLKHFVRYGMFIAILSNAEWIFFPLLLLLSPSFALMREGNFYNGSSKSIAKCANERRSKFVLETILNCNRPDIKQQQRHDSVSGNQQGKQFAAINSGRARLCSAHCQNGSNFRWILD